MQNKKTSEGAKTKCKNVYIQEQINHIVLPNDNTGNILMERKMLIQVTSEHRTLITLSYRDIF